MTRLHIGRQAEALRPYIGQWVALGDEPWDVIAASKDPRQLAGTLKSQGLRSQGIFRVPERPAESGGAHGH